MATVTTRPQPWNRDESQRRVAHPLQRLRGYIRSYVAAEGLAVLVIYLALWFWLGLPLDYGFFKAFNIDWVQVLPHTFRVVVLCGLTAGLLAVVAVKVFVRLFREFRKPALALVLERRFPGLLGDRLITAVEMADPRLAERYGYSQAMIDQTIRDAADRVDQVPVGEVFNWKRLRRYGLAVVLLTAGLYLLAGAVYCAASRATASQFVQRFNDVAVIWFERNILLIDTIWPRRSHLELVGFPPSGDLRIGRDAPPPTLRVKALVWVIADNDRKRAPEGWRALHWADLKPDLLAAAPVPRDLPAGWDGQSLDWIELQLDKPEVVNSLPADHVLGLRELFRRLEETAGQPKMSRRLRKLEVPQEATVYLKGATASSEQSLQKESDNEFTVTLSDLKESVRFTVRGEDYYTPYKHITVVPPPTLVELLRDDARPAYLYHRPPLGGEPRDLRGRKQKVENLAVSLAGDTSRIEVPSGTDVVLTAKTDKPLAGSNGVRILPPRKGVAAVKVPIERLDANTFRTRFADITRPIDFVFEFTDTDNVLGRRHLIIKPTEDAPPEVDVQVEVLRKTNQGYLCTPVARVPFSGKVRDDWGLAAVEYAYTLARLESPASLASRSAAAAGLVPSLADGGLGQRLTALGVVASLGRPADDADKAPERAAVDTFVQLLKERAARDVSPEKLAEALHKEPPKQPLLKDHTFDPEREAEGFKLAPLGIKVKEENATQAHYRLRLWVMATDTNIETGPRSADSKEKFTLLVVSEDELLTEIGKEEETLHVKLEEAINRLKDAQAKLDKVASELPELKPEDFSPMTLRAVEIEEALVKSWDATREVYIDYARILKEEQVNSVRQEMINKVKDKICEPLDGAIRFEFVNSERSLKDFKEGLEKKNNDPKAAGQAREDLQKVIDRLSGVLEQMGEIITINKLIEQLVKIKNAEEEEYKRLLELRREQEKKLLEGIEGPKPKDKK
jgi:hypothetical protein